MRKYDVFPNPSGDGYLLDVQTDLLIDLNTRVIVPLLPTLSAPKPETRLNPIFDFEDQPVVTVTQFMAAVPTVIFAISIGNLDEGFEEVKSALDMLIQGF
jgi:toxin CcdB